MPCSIPNRYACSHTSFNLPCTWVQIQSGPEEGEEVRIRIEGNDGELSIATAKNPTTRITWVNCQSLLLSLSLFHHFCPRPLNNTCFRLGWWARKPVAKRRDLRALALLRPASDLLTCLKWCKNMLCPSQLGTCDSQSQCVLPAWQDWQRFQICAHASLDPIWGHAVFSPMLLFAFRPGPTRGGGNWKNCLQRWGSASRTAN